MCTCVRALVCTPACVCLRLYIDGGSSSPHHKGGARVMILPFHFNLVFGNHNQIVDGCICSRNITKLY